jgi:LasA protease
LTLVTKLIDARRPRLFRVKGARLFAFIVVSLAAALACARADIAIDYANITPVGEATPAWHQGPPAGPPTATLPAATAPVAHVPTATARATQDTSNTPTPDPTRPSILDRTSLVEYVVQPNDHLNRIGQRYGVSASAIAIFNGMQLTDILSVGQVLLIPLPNTTDYGPALKLLPDSEFVYGPGSVGFNLHAFVQSQGGYLARYVEEVPGRYLDGTSTSRTISGTDIVQVVAERYSVSPRLLLAVLEYQSGWVTQRDPDDNTLAFPIGQVEVGREGLYRQLAWAANVLNRGYYSWQVGSIISWNFGDGTLRLVARGLNPGTVGVQNFFAALLIPSEWERAVAPDGFMLTYWRLFGNPFMLAHEPLVPPDLVQPPMQLPFEPGRVWAFTGGPHGAWDTGSGWGALDFGPPDGARGCAPSDEWVVAAAPGLIVRTGDGAVIQDLDGDGYEQTGWVLFYMHIEARDRVEVGTWVEPGDRIGHASCEGGYSDATHLHIARKYNGEWVAADGPIPFIMDGWVSAGLQREYNGTLTKGTHIIEACNCRATRNEVARP